MKKSLSEMTLEELNLSLWKKYEHNRDYYTSAKGAFIAQQTQNAKEKYGS